jgi:hypothetical protein
LKIFPKRLALDISKVYLYIMKATIENIGQIFSIRLIENKWFRHYGGREITQKIHVVKVTLVGLQDDHQRYIVTLNEPCIGFKSGHKIAVCENDFGL